MVTTMPRESYARARSKLFFFAGKLENKKVWNSLAKNFKNRYNKRTRAHTHTHAPVVVVIIAAVLSSTFSSL